MPSNSLQDLFVEDLKDLYNAENQILKALPKMVKAASTPELKSAFDQHLKQTKGQVERLEFIFNELGCSAQGKVCKGIKGIIEEGEEGIKEGGNPQTTDAALIGAAQKVEHYEIAGYGTVRTYAQMLGNNKAAQLLQQTLDEEGQTDRKLTQLAEDMVNVQATQPQ